MIIDRAIGPFVILGQESLVAALTKITANKARILFVADSHGHLIGALSDGDVRRWLIANPNADLTTSVDNVANRNVRSASCCPSLAR